MNERLKEIRLKLNMSQDEFADKLGLTKSAISGHETGRRNITEQTIVSICREFNVSRTWLESGVGSMFIEMDRDDEITVWAASVARPSNDNEYMKKFAHMLSKLNEEDWKVLEKMAKLMEEEHKKG